MADFAAEFLFSFDPVQGIVDSIPEQVFFNVAVPKTSPIFSFSPTTGNAITRTTSVQVDVTDDTGVLADVTIWATLADGSTETVWANGAFTALFSGSTTPITLGTRYTFAFTGFGWPTSSVTIHVQATDTVGAPGSASAAYTISNPPTAPTIASFSPATGGSQTRATSVQVDVTDAEGASALVLVLVTAITADGVRRRVAAGGTVYAPFTAGSSRSPIANGYRYVVAWDAPGWPSTTAAILVEAMNARGLASSASWSATITDPPAAPSVVFSPATGGSMARGDSVQVDVTDDEGASAIVLTQAHAILDDGSEHLAVSGATLKPPFTAGSSRSSIANGYRYVIAWDAPGWPSSTAGLRFDAMDAQGQVTSVSWSATVTDPPAAPVIGGFVPANSGSTTRAGTVRIEVTDDEGAAAIAHMSIAALLSDGTVRGVYDGDGATDFADDFSGATRTSITGGYRFNVVFDGDGWPSSTLRFFIRATDAQGRSSTATLDLTVSDPPAPPDATAPTVTFAPNGGPIAAGQPITVTVVDPGQLRRVVIAVSYPSGLDERAWTGYAFTPFYAAGSTVTGDVTTGLTFVLVRRSGWPGDPTPEVLALDKAGNEA